MTIQEIFDLAIDMAIKADPRGKEFVKKLLAKNKEDYENLSEKKKKYFDKESFTNPYSDTRIYTGDPKQKVKKILAGIDGHASDLLLFDRLCEKGLGLDLYITHHPEGIGLTGLHEVMEMQTDVYGSI